MTIEQVKTVGIIGAGTMGQGIAQVCASSGYQVILFDVNGSLLTSAYQSIEKGLTSLISKGKITELQKSETLLKISLAKSLSDVKADIVIEAVVERLDVKQQLFAELANNNADGCVLVSNTSSIPITQIASGIKNTSRIAGLHFFNPAPVMKLVEVIKGASTSDETVELLMRFTKTLSKQPVFVQDSPGFIVNRVARHFYVESLKILEENVTDIESIDALLKNAGFKMGPFELMDLIGIDVNFAVTSSLFNSFHQDPKFRPNRIQQQKVIAGHLGRKTGKGFYDYSNNK